MVDNMLSVVCDVNCGWKKLYEIMITGRYPD